MDSHLWKARSVILHRDAQGFGLTVSGDNPVSVQTIKRGGPAELAGIREGDIITKVNGTPVEHLNHPEVVNHIKSAGSYVTLTVRPPDLVPLPGMGLVGGNGPRPHSTTQDLITAPIPVDVGIQMQMQDNKLRTLQVYRDQAFSEYEKCLKKFESSQNARDKRELEKAEKSLRSIETQMKAIRQNSPNLQLHSPAPFSPFPHTHQPVQFQPYPHFAPAMHQLVQPQYQFQPSYSPESAYPNSRTLDCADVPPPLPPRSFSQSLSFANDNSYPTSPGNSRHEPFPGHPNQVHAHFHGQFDEEVGKGGDATNRSPTSSQHHHRAKSSPDPVSMQKALKSEASKRSDSVSNLAKNSPRCSTSDFTDSRAENTPPGSPPPPYGKHVNSSASVDDSFNSMSFSSGDFSPSKSFGTPGSHSINHFAALDIISMEDDDGVPADRSLQTSTGKHDPYSSLSRLLEHNAHLAVFMNFVIDNHFDPSSLLFYLITGLSLEEGTTKEMKRWGYEVHSTFTAPGSPLLVPNVDENIAAEIDDTLVRESDREEMMRRVFRKARNKAKEEINKQLEEFCNKRITGLGSMFGPPDNQMEESVTDKNRELRIVEEYLVPRLEYYLNEWDKNADDRTWAISSALSTLLQRQFGLRSPKANCVLERCSSFVSKDKSVRSKFMSKSKKTLYNGHHFTPKYLYSYKECNICSKLLWGVGPQGLQCSDCNVTIHRNCLQQMQDNCLGSEPEGLKKKDRLRQIKDKIRPSKSDPKRRSAIPMKAFSEDNFAPGHGISMDSESGDKSSPSTSSKNDRRPDTLNEEQTSQDTFSRDEDRLEHAQQEPRRSSNAVGRSESCKERVQRKQTRERRKHSDPNLTSKKTSDDLENQRQLSDANSGSSSTSSLSGGRSDSPSTSSEFVGHGRSSETPETTVGHSNLSDSYKVSQSWEGDSDIEIDQDAPDWTRNVPEDVLREMSPREKKRQEILNELLHTERSHVRNLKVMDRLFYKPLRSSPYLPPDLVLMLFANLEEMLDMHGQFNAALKRKRKEAPLIGDIGPVLLETFDGDSAQTFKKAAANCCARQQIGLKQLKERREKSPKLNAFLQEAEQDPVCRRLQLQDMIPMAMQRLTKYPLIFENLCHCTATDSVEHKNLQRAVEMSKDILNSVNQAKKESEDHQRLVDIQRRLDKSSLEKGIASLEKGLDKSDLSIINELRNLDLTKHKLIYEGPLMWRLKSNKQKSEALQDVQLVLLHDMVVILLKQDDRYVLKIHVSPSYPGKSAERVMARPVIKLNNLIHRANAADKRAFLLVNMTSTNMYELVCSTPEERKSWLHHITKAAEDYKSRQQESRRSDVLPSANIPSSLPELDDKNKESRDIGEDGDSLSVQGLQKEASPAPDSISSKEGDNAGIISAGSEKSPSASASPKPARKMGEFLIVTETSPPLIDPAEVVVATRDVQFAQPVISQYEELKRVDSSISKAFDEKMKLISHIHHIPTNKEPDFVEDSFMDLAAAKDARELVIMCMQKVDQLGQLLGSHKVTSDNMPTLREEANIQQSLSSMLTQLLSEIHRKDEQEEIRRLELHRIREQNHGYQERLIKSRSKEALISPGTSSDSAAVSPIQSRPHSLLSASSSEQHDDPEIVRTKPLLKSQSCDRVASSNSNALRPLQPDESGSSASTETLKDESQQGERACDVGQEEFADAFEELLDVSNSEDDTSVIEKTKNSKSALATAASCPQASPTKVPKPTNGHEALAGDPAHN